MQELIKKLKKVYPDLKFKSGNQFYWSPESKLIIYKASGDQPQDIWSLLHETGHALLSHKTYKADYELVKMEVSAWKKAKELAGTFKIDIDNDHIEDCLDTYRDWLHKRSICPTCGVKSLQQDNYTHYQCYNCHTVWKVSSSRFCRSYRAKDKNLQPETL
jgi:hypothetical protein